MVTTGRVDKWRLHSKSSLIVRLELWTNRIKAWTNSDTGGRNSGSDWNKETKQNIIIISHEERWCIYCRVWITWTERAMISANRKSDLGGYSPRKAGSTIFSTASMSWRSGVAQRTRHCSAFGLELSTRNTTQTQH